MCCAVLGWDGWIESVELGAWWVLWRVDIFRLRSLVACGWVNEVAGEVCEVVEMFAKVNVPGLDMSEA